MIWIHCAIANIGSLFAILTIPLQKFLRALLANTVSKNNKKIHILRIFVNITKVTIHITSKTGKRIYARRERAKKGIITILLLFDYYTHHK